MSLRHKIRHCKLFHKTALSIMEMMITLFIFSLLGAGLMAVFTVGDASWRTNKVDIELQQELRKAMEAMVFELRETGPGAITDVPADDAWHYSVITFQAPATVTSGSLTWETGDTVFQLGGSGGTQLHRVESGNTKVICDYIQTLGFRRFAAAPDKLDVTMIVQKNTTKGLTMQSTLDFSIQLRN